MATMTDEEKHEWCRRLGMSHALFINQSEWNYFKQSNCDMRLFVLQKPIPENPENPEKIKW